MCNSSLIYTYNDRGEVYLVCYIENDIIYVHTLICAYISRCSVYTHTYTEVTKMNSCILADR